MTFRWTSGGAMTAHNRFIILAFLLSFLAAVPLAGAAAQAPGKIDPGARKTGPSGLPLPRFVSLKADEVNVRRGPGWDHGVAWVFRRAGLPVEVVAEFDVWRQIRDSEGSTGWVLGTLLSGRRTVLVAPWKTDQHALELHRSASASAEVKARLAPGVLGDVENCSGEWCRITAGSVSGYISQDLVWGAYPGEKSN
jgi:SH3-like domain-containing protein